ncbi:MAG: hypothetical protein L6Q57_01060 [Alphaproteobacteria bacterium]|nr:hypothetical protein [Alphaproteobacteria bacterium]
MSPYPRMNAQSQKLTLAAADHACNVVRRQMADEYPDLHMVFILHDGQRKDQAIARKIPELRMLPGASKLLYALEANKDASLIPPGFIGLRLERSRPWFVLRREQASACALLDYSIMADADAMQIEARRQGWYALRLLQAVREEKQSDYIQIEGVLRPALAPDQYAYNNLLADIYCAYAQEFLGAAGSVRNFAAKLALNAITPVAHAKPEFYPLPAAVDIVQAILEDFGPRTENLRPLHRAWRLMEEAARLCDQRLSTQWQSFARAAQDMAWAGVHRNKILGAAVYTNEDPYTRSIAYLLAETLDIEPAMPVENDFLNAFADPETNARHHQGLCIDALDRCISKAILNQDNYVFLDEWVRQNKRLMQGEYLGWCAPGLVRALQILNNRDGDADTLADRAQKTFMNTLQEVPWETVQALGQAINARRAQGEEITQDKILMLMKEHESFRAIATILSFDVFAPRRHEDSAAESEPTSPQDTPEDQGEKDKKKDITNMITDLRMEDEQ